MHARKEILSEVLVDALPALPTDVVELVLPYLAKCGIDRCPEEVVMLCEECHDGFCAEHRPERRYILTTYCFSCVCDYCVGPLTSEGTVCYSCSDNICPKCQHNTQFRDVINVCCTYCATCRRCGKLGHTEAACRRKIRKV